MNMTDFFLGRKTAVMRPGQMKSFSQQSSGLLRLPAVPGTGSESLIKAYRENQLVRACVDILANSATDPRIIVQNRTADEQWEEVVGHPFRQLLIMPNPEMDEAAFFNFAQASIEVVGVFYAEIVRSAALPIELWPLQPLSVTPKYVTRADGSRDLTHYEFKDGSYSKDIKPEDMLVRDDFALGGRLSPLASAMRNVDSDIAQVDYVRAFFNNAGVPSGILKFKDREIDQEESDRIRAQWRAKYGRQYGNQNDLVVLDENAMYERIGAKLDELDSSTLRGFDESRIAMAFGVPPLIVYAQLGLMRATYSNLGDAWKHFWLTTMSAKLKLWRSFFITTLLPEFENIDDVKAEKSRLAWDMSMVGALQESVDLVLDRERKLFMSGGATLNEYRAAVGMMEYPEAEMGAMNYFQLRASSTGGAIIEAMATEETEKDVEVDDLDVDNQKGIATTAEVEVEPGEIDAAVARTSKALFGQPIDELKISDDEQEQMDEYAGAVYALAKSARSGNIDQDEFEKELRELSETNLVAFFLLGSLLDDDEITDEEIEAIGPHVAAARESAETFGDDIYSGRYGGVHRDEDAEGVPASLENRAVLWGLAAGTVLVLGRVFRKDDPILTWQRGETLEPCDDCLAFEGTSMRASIWKEKWDPDRLPQGRGLECAGYNCLCDLVE